MPCDMCQGRMLKLSAAGRPQSIFKGLCSNDVCELFFKFEAKGNNNNI